MSDADHNARDQTKETTVSTDKQEAHEKFVLGYYKRNPRDIGSIRSALSDAAHMCDCIAGDIVTENTLRNGRITLKGIQMREALKRAGDAIWALREKVTP